MQECPNCLTLNDEKSHRNHYECSSCGCWYDVRRDRVVVHKAWPIVKEWNSQFSIGQAVVVKEDFKSKGTVTKTSSQAQIMGGDVVIWLDGISGCYCLSHVIAI